MTVTATLTRESSPGGVFDEGVTSTLADRMRDIAVAEAPIYTGGDPRKQAVAGQVKKSIRARIVYLDLDHVAIEVYSNLPGNLVKWILEGTKSAGFIYPRHAGSGRRPPMLKFWGR